MYRQKWVDIYFLPHYKFECLLVAAFLSSNFASVGCIWYAARQRTSA